MCLCFVYRIAFACPLFRNCYSNYNVTIGQMDKFVYVIAWAQGQLKINFTSIFKVFTKLPASQSDEGNLENFENTSEINP